jgi:AcrR family transcriptional regulator
VEAARRRFSEVGFDRASIRSIAGEAGVDPALAVHFFGSKEELFREALAWPFDPADVARRVAGGGGRGERLARVFLELWEDAETRRPLLALLRSAMTHDGSAALLQQFVEGQLFRRLADQLEGEDQDLRIDLAASQLIGLALLRHVLRVEPLASASPDTLVAWLAPTLERYLAG